MPGFCRDDGKLYLGVLDETKDPPDVRVPLTPAQCVQLVKQHPNICLVVQKSATRCYSDAEYQEAGVKLVDDVGDLADVLIGVKEVAKSKLVPGKVYLFFSHTAKKQSYNRELLQKMVNMGIQMVDYEYLRNPIPGVSDINLLPRSIAFGRWAGIVGAHNSLLAWGKRSGSYDLPRLSEFKDFAAASELHKKMDIRGTSTRIVVTGDGRVSRGCVEVLKNAGLRELTPEEFLQGEETPVFAMLPADCLYRFGEDKTFNDLFFENPEGYRSVIWPYLCKADVLINGIYWDKRTVPLFTADEMRHKDFRVKVIGDITCDIAPESSIPSTLRSSTIAEPFFGYDPQTEKEVAPFSSPTIVDVMAVDNLPNELPRDASEAFGDTMTTKIIPEMLVKDSAMLLGASITKNGALTPGFAYLQDFLDGK